MPARPGPPIEGIGTRIQQVRLLRGYSLRELAARAHVSAAQISRIESGSRYASSTIVASIARALSVSVSVLHGQPYIHMLQHDQLDSLLSPISSALDDWDIPPAGADPPPRSLAELDAAVRALDAQRAAGRYLDVALELPALISEVNYAALLQDRPGQNRERARWLQAEVGRTVYVVARQIGYVDLARHALGRMAAAAPHSGDPRQVAIERWDRSQLMADAARHDRGFALVRQALHDLGDGGDNATLAVRGALYLRAAVLARRSGDESTAGDWLREAGELAERTGELSDYGLVFGPTNVVIHAMSASADMDRHARALKEARKVRLPKGYPAARAGAYWVSRARAEAWTAQHDEALRSLAKAKEVAPQQTRYHPGVHETVGTLLRARARVADPLREFASWCGV
ncbi:helix-turn-helix domain-containing protein [Streptomyces litchfieldiae]|uniref:Helix-turn-helix transcriptional regulator n=1 Tax=Streptomyces litchfieldiae TaxID=3075543 RepID=A0ABU2MMT7_9ACTN|nr:helix-turn-helix transcriptional regulator [Streptomyces sp. DSM 44938]MDT0342673.1 helix-turn-helix transcriptional regulator [Streptomyces sp. DSM 44938]